MPGTAPVRVMLKEGLNVALGSDIAGGDHLSMGWGWGRSPSASTIAWRRFPGAKPGCSPKNAAPAEVPKYQPSATPPPPPPPPPPRPPPDRTAVRPYTSSMTAATWNTSPASAGTSWGAKWKLSHWQPLVPPPCRQGVGLGKVPVFQHNRMEAVPRGEARLGPKERRPAGTGP